MSVLEDMKMHDFWINTTTGSFIYDIVILIINKEYCIALYS